MNGSLAEEAAKETLPPPLYSRFQRRVIPAGDDLATRIGFIEPMMPAAARARLVIRYRSRNDQGCPDLVPLLPLAQHKTDENAERRV